MKTQNIILSNKYISLQKILNILLLILIIVIMITFFSIKRYKVVFFNFKDLFFHSNIIRAQINRNILNSCLGIEDINNRPIIQAINNTILLFNENED
ncbi:hypothetical protein IOLA_056 [uncultured bacterium]|nr:hypothetical protein IOLA_056 [uncultured bacterium]